MARFELEAEVLHNALTQRRIPCNFDGGGCMGLDQLLFQDTDGTLIGTHIGTLGSRRDFAAAYSCIDCCFFVVLIVFL